MIAEVTDVGLFRGGLLLFACGSGLVVLAACEPGPVRWLCSIPVLISLGRISYGVYIYHWPIFIWLNAARTGLDPLMLTVVRMSVTVGLAVVCYVLVEQPIRQRRFVKGRGPGGSRFRRRCRCCAGRARRRRGGSPARGQLRARDVAGVGAAGGAPPAGQASPETQPVASHTEESAPEALRRDR